MSPLFLFGAVAAAVPIVLHLLKREPEPRVKFAAVALLQARAGRTHTPRRRLRQIVLLALRVAALRAARARLCAALRPAGRGSAATRSATVIALDTSFSMSAPGQVRAGAAARARSRGPVAGTTDDVGVVTFADRAELVAPPSADRALALCGD